MNKRIKINDRFFNNINEAAVFFGIEKTKFRQRYYRGFNFIDLIYKGDFAPSGNKKDLKKVEKEVIQKLRLFKKRKNIRKMEDWYKVPFHEIAKVLRAYFKRKYVPVDIFLKTIYPKYNFLLWKFSTVPKGTWDIKENRINYIKWLRKRLKIKKLSGFYKIKHNDIMYKHYGNILSVKKDKKSKTHGKKYNMLSLLKETYPNYSWKFWLFFQAPTKSWKDIANQREFFEHVIKQEKINVNSDSIYQLSFKTLSDYGGKTISGYYPTYIDFIKKMLPGRKIDKFKFKYVGHNFWLNKKNQKEALLYLGKKLGFKKKNDWYGIKYEDFKNFSFYQLLKPFNHSPGEVVVKLLPYYNFDKTKFDFSSKYEFRLRCYAKCLFGYKNIEQNKKLNIFRSRFSGRRLELDIWVPHLKLGLEYQGELHYKKGIQSIKGFEIVKRNDKEKKRLAKLNKIKIVEFKWKEWNGMPKTFLNTINKFTKLSKNQINIFWKRFKKDDLFNDILEENRNYTKIFM